ncbi:MAG: hypothetical protein Q3996_01260 [Candidatus Saccharibacteria bacterium]|nr:hypothetical protein [Candidatus Saccharibacteria bacterium]
MAVKIPQIVPTILTNNVEEFQAALVMLNEFTKHVQIDVSDGQFATNKTISLNQIFWPEDWQVDLHLMMKKPSEIIDQVILMKPRLVIVHAEIEDDMKLISSKLHQAGIKFGIALLKSTVPETKSNLIAGAEHVLIFAGELGQMGGQASILQTEKVRLIRKISPMVEIGWDGGANIDNLSVILRSGVDIVNVGSAISMTPNPQEAFKQMVEMTKKNDII